MKKLLALVLVLGLATVATAGDTYGDIGFMPVGPQEVDPSDIFYIDVLAFSASGTDYLGINSTGFLMITIDGPASFVGNEDYTYYPDFEYRPADPPPPPVSDEWCGYNQMQLMDPQTLAVGGGLPAGVSQYIVYGDPEETTMMFDHIGIHCDGPGDIIITVIPSGDDAAGIPDMYYGCPVVMSDGTGWVLGRDLAPVGGSIVVHQTPEPMTVALLGLGGLALIRRRRA